MRITTLLLALLPALGACKRSCPSSKLIGSDLPCDCEDEWIDAIPGGEASCFCDEGGFHCDHPVDDTADSHTDTSDSDPPPYEPTHTPGPDCTDEPWPLKTPWNVLADHIMAGVVDEGMAAEIETLVLSIEKGSSHGPWEHAIAGPWTSADGLSWLDESDIVLEQASVPDLVIDDEGVSWLFFNDTRPKAIHEAALSGETWSMGIPMAGLFAARSLDGLVFERVTLEMSGPRPLTLVDPDIRRLSDGTYRLFYFGLSAESTCADSLDPSRSPGPHDVWTATSSDLVTWESEGVAWTFPAGGSDPASWCDGETCWIAMNGGAVSTDSGATFSETTLQLPDGPLVPDVFPTAGGWRMLWHRSGEPSLRSAFSVDGTRFEEEGPVNATGDAPGVFEVGEGAVMYVNVQMISG